MLAAPRELGNESAALPSRRPERAPVARPPPGPARARRRASRPPRRGSGSRAAARSATGRPRCRGDAAGHRRGERLRAAHPAEPGRQDRAPGERRCPEVLLRGGRERLVGALQDPLRADVDPRARPSSGRTSSALRLEPPELVPGRPLRHEQRVRDQHARRARRRPEHRDRLSGLNEQRLVVSQLEQRLDDRLQRLV